MKPNLPLTQSQVHFKEPQPQSSNGNLKEVVEVRSHQQQSHHNEPENPELHGKKQMTESLFKNMRLRRKKNMILSNQIQYVPRPQQEHEPITKSIIIDQVKLDKVDQQLAIDSKLEQNKPVGIQCDFCAQNFENDKLDKAFKCEHIYCSECLKIYLETQIKNFKLIQCPEQPCKLDINQQSKTYKSLPKYLSQNYQIVKFRKKVEANPNLRLCPDENCKKGYIQVKQGQKIGQCKQCKVMYCLNCRIKSHSGKCQSFQQILLKDKFKYKQCHACKRVVERISGCPHMTCKCGSQFCYYCEGKWQVPHRCIRFLAGGDLITDRLNNGLRCMRVESYEYEYTFLGFLLKIPYYLLCLLILSLYICWALTVLAVLIAVGIICSLFAGYIALQYKMCKESNALGKIVFVILLVLLPLGVLIGWIAVFCVCVYNVFPKYLEVALSGKLFPCFFLC